VRRQPDARPSKGLTEEARRIETEISSLESRLAELEEAIVGATERQDTRALWELGEEYQRVEEALHRRLEEWTVMTSRLQAPTEDLPGKAEDRTSSA
jgi:predicted  nucleic acid-binding Zn-ribbon protein